MLYGLNHSQVVHPSMNLFFNIFIKEIETKRFEFLESNPRNPNFPDSVGKIELVAMKVKL
jgi:hypothetical protein